MHAVLTGYQAHFLPQLLVLSTHPSGSLSCLQRQPLQFSSPCTQALISMMGAAHASSSHKQLRVENEAPRRPQGHFVRLPQGISKASVARCAGHGVLGGHPPDRPRVARARPVRGQEARGKEAHSVTRGAVPGTAKDVNNRPWCFRSWAWWSSVGAAPCGMTCFEMHGSLQRGKGNKRTCVA
eukprot:scaffold113262_cov21-Tisochrysis_lutea.AAC.1